MGVTKGATGRGARCGYIRLSGELDISKVSELREILDLGPHTKRFVFVDLGGVTFLDSLCLKELIVAQHLHAGRLALCSPSQQVEISVAACGLDDWVTFYPNKNGALRSMLEEIPWYLSEL